jgi:predicted DCC family thiol-disulfide oxidoreductase YuxK
LISVRPQWLKKQPGKTMPDPHPIEQSAQNEGPLILFDGVCNLCSWAVQFLAPRDRRGSFMYAAMQSRTGQEKLRRHGLPMHDYESFILLEDGRAYTKSQAIFQIVRHMRYPWPLLRIGLILPRGFSDWLYDRVARNRYALFGKKDVCMVPRKDIAPRFLD